MLALGVLLLFVSLASVLGLSTAFGAYISGSVVSMWKKRWRSLENDLSKFSYIFISFFFFSVGLKADVSGVSFLMLAVMLPVILIAKFSGVFVAVYDALGRTREPFFTSIGMLSRGELSLVIVSAAIGAGLLPASFLGLTALLVLLTVVISFVLMSRATDVYGLIRSRFPKASF